ncbi:hypothetical protein HK104_011406 [Borealophlyctis nickersoniae]|nr:hypothetical protein HK104_011406 [Borealophlyctis nickersoniae]
MIPPVTVTPAPSGRPIVYGTLTLKRLAGKSRKNVLLSHPQTTEDIRASFELLQKMGGRSPKQGKPGAGAWSDVSKEDIEVLGNLSAAAVGGSPIFILAGNPRTFLHFSQILRVLDEEAIGVACCITIETGQKEYKFSVDTSVDYQMYVYNMVILFLANKISDIEFDNTCYV